MKQKIKTLLRQLNHGLVDRESTLKTALLTVLAGENLILIGPPGTGKSEIARRVANSFVYDNNNSDVGAYFEYLLTKFSTPEEIFGPLSITELKADRFKRNTAGYLPTVKMAFLDEIFKASSSILNALLTILNERLYHNGAEPQKVPLQALIAASNELPTDQEELSALYDRFLVRSFVDYVKPDKLLQLFKNAGSAPPALTKLGVADLEGIQRAAKAIVIPSEIEEAVQRIWIQHRETFKEDRREVLSDRRLTKVIKLLCVSAATNGRDEVDLSDVFLLKDCLWNHQENAPKVGELIRNILRSFSRPVAGDDVTIEMPKMPADTSGKPENVVKGLRGSGTEQDPLLIQTVEELMDLSRPDVGLQGYYFRQTADVDCSGINSWRAIPFKGHYDGDGHTTEYRKAQSDKGRLDSTETGWRELFSSIQPQSSITNLKLEGVRLTAVVDDSHIINCRTNADLIKDKATGCTVTACLAGRSLINGTATGCIVTACQAGRSLINGEVTKCIVSVCHSGDSLIDGTAVNSVITDCLVVSDQKQYEVSALAGISSSTNKNRGGIANVLTEGSVVERCFVSGKFECRKSVVSKGYFSGIASDCNVSIIRGCAVGKLEQISEEIEIFRLIGKADSASMLENNASIDSNRGTDDIDGRDGKSISPILFKQRFFEYTLGWDFDTVWQWDDKNDRPALRSAHAGTAAYWAHPAMQKKRVTDLLTQQVRANLWL